jgi:site-specific DNA-methyltransferase (adenine-specific)
MKNDVLEGSCFDLIPTLPDGSIDCVITSPPYANQRKKFYEGVSEDAYPQFTVDWMEALKPKLKPNGSVLINIRTNHRDGIDSSYVLKTRLALLDAGFHEISEIIWVKGSAPVGSRIRLRRNWESILWYSLSRRPFCQPKACGKWSKRASMVGSNRFSLFNYADELKEGIARISDVISVPVGCNEKGVMHPATFPQKLVDILIPTFCPKGGTVLDPFAGSGTVGLSAIDKKRNFVLIEKKNEYIQIINQRIKEKNGQEE